jgi:hypothetical protein
MRECASVNSCLLRFPDVSATRPVLGSPLLLWIQCGFDHGNNKTSDVACAIPPIDASIACGFHQGPMQDTNTRLWCTMLFSNAGILGKKAEKTSQSGKATTMMTALRAATTTASC